MKLKLIILILVLSVSANARTLYVSTTGDDSRTATQATNIATPWRTPGKAFSTAIAGDTVYFRGGILLYLFISGSQ